MKVLAEGNDREKITVVLFEESVVKLIGKPAAVVFDEVIRVFFNTKCYIILKITIHMYQLYWYFLFLQQDTDDPKAFPMDFQDLLDRQFLCKVRVTYDYNIIKNYKDFSVDKLTDDEDIIRQYLNVIVNVSL